MKSRVLLIPLYYFFRTGQLNVDTDRVAEKMMMVLGNQDDTEVRIWDSTEDFDESWIDFITTHQSHLIDVSQVKKARSWFKLLINEDDPSASRWQCKICSKMRDISLLKTSQLPECGSPGGVLKKNFKLNQNLLINHPKSVAHKRYVLHLIINNSLQSLK